MDVAAYLREISDVGRRYGLGLAGEISLFLLEEEDMPFDYSADVDGHVRLGLPKDALTDPEGKAKR